MTEGAVHRARRTVAAVAGLPRRPVAGTVALLLLSTAGMAGIVAVLGTPVPRVYDEFAYLLSADTFAGGRLTNPTHVHWRHFETFEVIHRPSYQAKYPPAQGLLLAAGLVLGHPVVGVWISVLLMVVATAWALRSLLRPEWAFAATLLLVLQLGIASYWAQSYWGGAVAAAGGGLAFGTAARLIARRATWWDGCLGGLGLALLANSRPLEGLVLAAALAAWIGFAALRWRLPSGLLVRTLAPGLMVAGAGLMFTAIYNHAVTGSYTTMPYTVHERTYALAPFLIFMQQPAPSQDYLHGEIERQHRTRGLERHERLRDEGPWAVIRRAPRLAWTIGGGGMLLLAFLALAWSRAGTKFATGAFGLLALTVLLTPAAHPHYLAPGVAPLYFLFGVTASSLGAKARSRSATLTNLIMAMVVLVALVQVGVQARQKFDQQGDWADQRTWTLEALRAEPQRDLVFVHYPTEYGRRVEWVYNRADIDAAEVVWARPISADADLALVEYFETRRVWDLEISENGERIGIKERTRPALARKALP